MVLHKVTGSPVKWSLVIDVKAALRCMSELQHNTTSQYAIQTGSFRSDYYIGFTGLRSSGRVSRSSIQGSNSPHGRAQDALCCCQSFGNWKVLWLVPNTQITRSPNLQVSGTRVYDRCGERIEYGEEQGVPMVSAYKRFTIRSPSELRLRRHALLLFSCAAARPH